MKRCKGNQKYFSNDIRLFLCGKEKILTNCRSRIFPIKKLDKIPTHKPALAPRMAPDPTPGTKPQPTSKSEL